MLNSVIMKRLVAIVTALGVLIGAAVALADHPIELGSTTNRPAVSCPTNCQAIGQVTGFEAQQGTTKHPFQPTRRGKVVAFSITLGKPKDSDISFFTKLFGGDPAAQIAVLKPVPKKKQQYTVSGLSDVFQLAPVLRLDPHLRPVPAAHGEAGLRGRPDGAHLGAGIRRRPRQRRGLALIARPRTLRRRPAEGRADHARQDGHLQLPLPHGALDVHGHLRPGSRVTNPPATKKKTGTTG